MLQNGRRGVLREEIAAYLEGLGLPGVLATDNDGKLIVSAQDLRVHRWIASSPPSALGPAGALDPVTVIVRPAPAPPRRLGVVDHLVNQQREKSQ